MATETSRATKGRATKLINRPAPGDDALSRLLVESISDYAIITIDTQGLVTTWNRGAERIKGYRPEEIIGRHFSCFYLQDKIEAGFPAQELKIAATEGRFKDEDWRVRKDGSRFWASVIITPLRDHTGKLLGFGKVTRDLSEREQATERFRLIVESAPNAIVMANQKGTIVLVNSQTEQLFGYMRDELIGQSVDRLVPERVRSTHPSYRAGFFTDPKTRPMGAGRDLYGVHKDGHEIPVEIGLNPLVTEEGTFVLASIIDITARKQAAERFRLIVESTPNAIVMANQEGTIVLVNSQTERLFGYQRDELIGQSVDRLVPERVRSTHPSYRAGFFTDPKTRPMGAGRDLYGVHKDGHEIPVEIGLNPLVTEEGTFVLASIIDITARKQAEETIARQAQEILEVSTPVVQMWEGVIAAPLIGTLDSQRTEQFMERLLQRIVETNSPVALVDITGVPTIDTQTGQHLIETVTAVRMLGAQVVLTGVRPALAQTLVHLGIDLSHVITRSSMSAGVRVALDILNLQVVSKNGRR
jgi:PAS domain S-box-containing protein